jgi:UDP-N-acetylmuramyl pentapeptide phosphotransferase/UDP-N-acetylglucosamine-1-phosphate transferase
MRAIGEIGAAYALGVAATLVLWRGVRGVFGARVFERRNYRDQPLPTAVGLLLPLVVGTVVGAHVAVVDVSRVISGSKLDGWDALVEPGRLVVAIAVAFGFLGLVDDLGGAGESGGFSGHLRALREGRVTTGFVKLAGGAFLALAILGDGLPAGRLGHLRDAALVCVAANLGNLFDRAPGRVNKVGQLAFVVLVVATRSPRLVPIALVMGAAGALLGGDLREQFMLGDAGSNVIGAVVGVGVVLTTTETQRWIVLAVLLALNLASEAVSFTKVIDAVPPLAALDRLGSPHRSR